MKVITLYRYNPDDGLYEGEIPYLKSKDSSPPDFTTDTAPVAPDGHWPVWTGTEWEYVEDHRGQTAYATDLSGTLFIETLGVIPDGFTLTPPPPLASGFVVQWNSEKTNWEYIEDHRGTLGYIDGEETVITELGPPPENFTTEPPPPPEPEPVIPPPVDPIAERLREIEDELVANDRASVRPLRAKAAGTATADDEALLIKLEELAADLRAELASLETELESTNA